MALRLFFPSDPVKEGYNFSGWVPDVTVSDNKMPTSNVVFTAHWTINNYTLTFNFGNETNTSTEHTYNDTITYPTPTREGHGFNGWIPKPERMPAHVTTVVAQWTEIIALPSSSSSSYQEIVSELVEVVLDVKNMTKE